MMAVTCTRDEKSSTYWKINWSESRRIEYEENAKKCDWIKQLEKKKGKYKMLTELGQG